MHNPHSKRLPALSSNASSPAADRALASSLSLSHSHHHDRKFSSSSTEELHRKIEAQRKEIYDRTDDINAIQRNFQRLSEMFHNEKEHAEALQKELSKQGKEAQETIRQLEKVDSERLEQQTAAIAAMKEAGEQMLRDAERKYRTEQEAAIEALRGELKAEYDEMLRLHANSEKDAREGVLRQMKEELRRAFDQRVQQHTQIYRECIEVQFSRRLLIERSAAAEISCIALNECHARKLLHQRRHEEEVQQKVSTLNDKERQLSALQEVIRQQADVITASEKEIGTLRSTCKDVEMQLVHERQERAHVVEDSQTIRQELCMLRDGQRETAALRAECEALTHQLHDLQNQLQRQEEAWHVKLERSAELYRNELLLISNKLKCSEGDLLASQNHTHELRLQLNNQSRTQQQHEKLRSESLLLLLQQGRQVYEMALHRWRESESARMITAQMQFMTESEQALSSVVHDALREYTRLAIDEQRHTYEELLRLTTRQYVTQMESQDKSYKLQLSAAENKAEETINKCMLCYEERYKRQLEDTMATFKHEFMEKEREDKEQWRREWEEKEAVSRGTLVTMQQELERKSQEISILKTALAEATDSVHRKQQVADNYKRSLDDVKGQLEAAKTEANERLEQAKKHMRSELDVEAERRKLQKWKESILTCQQESVRCVERIFHVEEACESGYSCGDCFEIMKDPIVCVPCGHCFCRHCCEKAQRAHARQSSTQQRLYCPECEGHTVSQVIPSKRLELLGGKFSVRRRTLKDLSALLENMLLHSS